MAHVSGDGTRLHALSQGQQPHEPATLELLDRATEEGGRSRLHAESELLGVHHGELGGLIAQHWKLPDGIVRGVTFHHDPGHDDRFMDEVAAAAEALRPGTVVAREGMVLEP